MAKRSSSSKKRSYVDWAAFFRDAGLEGEDVELYPMKFILNEVKIEDVKKLEALDLFNMGIHSPVETKKILRAFKKEDMTKYVRSDDAVDLRGDSSEDDGVKEDSGKKSNPSAAARAAEEETTEEQEEKLEEESEAAQEDEKPASALDSSDAPSACCRW